MCYSLSLYAQGENITLKYFGLSIHPFGDRLAAVQPNKLDKNAHFVLNQGGFAGYERFIWRDIASVKLTQGLFTDCSAGFSGFTHLGLRGIIYYTKRTEILFSFGPLLYFRRSWTRFPQYVDQGSFAFTADKRYQYRVFWYGMEIEYNYRISPKTDFSVSFTPGVPFVMTFAVGLKYWLNKDYRFNRPLRK